MRERELFAPSRKVCCVAHTKKRTISESRSLRSDYVCLGCRLWANAALSSTGTHSTGTTTLYRYGSGTLSGRDQEETVFVSLGAERDGEL